MINYKNITLKRLTKDDKHIYYESGFKHPDEQVDYLTGTDKSYSYSQISDYVDHVVDQNDRIDFLIFSETRLVGEIVFSHIDTLTKHCDFRIAIFNQSDFSKKYGSHAMKAGLDYMISKHEIVSFSLEVYTFNLRAIHVYEKFGFKIISRHKDAKNRDYYIMRLTTEKH
ncbi:hypothetical protein BK011_09560 [Tenericutes bacterium MZ-XQ]|nr:hypothetical protein BK011_09560 [Tenericutes bacterium MZ-XQ]